MNLKNLKKILASEPNYRLKQAYQAIFFDLIDDWSQATILPLTLREKLNSECSLAVTAELQSSKKDRAEKVLITLSDGQKIESVLMRHNNNRNTVCVSSQVGCPLGCAFCATGKIGFRRNLETDEIIDQVLFLARLLKKDHSSADLRTSQKITNIVFMGMGEPFLNYDNVMEAISILNDPEGFNLGIRHFSISTVGITEGIRRLAKENKDINLAISLHAPNDKKRSELIPSAKKYNLKKIFLAVDYYIEMTNRKVMFEYLLIKGLNDNLEDARELAKIMKKPLYFVNLITYNPTGKFKPSDVRQVELFKNTLTKEGIKVTERHRFGQDIDAACGQLAGKKL